MTLSEYVAAIRNAGSRKTKTDLLLKYSKDPLFAKVVRYGMDPMLIFNVGKRSVTMPETFGDRHLTDLDFEYLDKLAGRSWNRTLGSEWANVRVRQLMKPEAELLIAILDKDLSWGLGASTINSVIPNMLFEFNCMLAAPMKTDKQKYPVRVEPKYDGMRVLAIIDGAQTSFYSRTGKPVSSLSTLLEEECRKLACALQDQLAIGGKSNGCQIMLDGEVMGDSFKETMEKARRKGETFEDAKFHVFDWLTLNEFRSIGSLASTKTYDQRRAQLDAAHRLIKELKGIKVPPSYMASSEEEALYFYNTFRDQGLEGAILKDPKGPYVGRRSPYWVKMKAEETEDLEIIGFEEGTGKYEGMLGALIVDRSGVAVRVGTGLTDEDRSLMWNNKGVYLHKLCEVQYQEVTPDGSLRHPRFIRLRMDKSEW